MTLRNRGRPKSLKKTKEVKETSAAAKAALIYQAFCSALSFEHTPDLDDWSDKHRYLPKETSHEHGVWKTSRFPFLRRIMKCLSPSSIAEEIVGMKGSQQGFTEIALCWMLYCADCLPGPMAYTQKTGEDVKSFSKQKLKPSIKNCERLLYILGENKPLGYSRTVTEFGYPGGFIALGKANSTGFLKSRSIRYAIMDEEDEYEMSVNSQGSPRKLLQRRMTNFPDRKLLRISTPVLEEFSTIKDGWLAGSQEQYYVPCPKCNAQANQDGFMFLIEWDTIRWSKEYDAATGDPKHTWCECPGCGSHISERKSKTWMLANGDWYSTKNINDPETPLPRYKVGDVKNPSFRIPSFYSPYGFYGWDDAVHDWHEYLRTRSPELLQVFINQVCAETFTLLGNDLDYKRVHERREVYSGNLDDFEVPLEAVCLTAGVDIQDDRIEVSVYGWGELEESWAIDYAVLVGDTALMGDNNLMLKNNQPSVWRLLDEYLIKRFKHESGAAMPIEITIVDTGHRSNEVHKFVKPREYRRIFAGKGVGGRGDGLWKRATRRHGTYGTIDYMLYSDELKAKTYALLSLDTSGPGYVHFPVSNVFDEKFFKGLTCEKRKTRMVCGQPRLYWDNPSGARNEPLDTRCYAYAAFTAYAVNIPLRAKTGLMKIFGSNTDEAPKPRRTKRGSRGF